MRVLVGTIGQTILASDDDGDSWRRLGPREGLHSDGIVRALATDPADPRVVWAGTDKGAYRSDDGGRQWRAIGGPLSGKTVWRLAVHPRDRKVIFGGTGTPSEPALYGSGDGGASWKELPVGIAAECDNVGVPRITDIAIDPLDPLEVWTAIEVDGIRHSRDGGESWTRIDGAIRNPDGHAAAVTAGPPKSVFITVSDEVFISQDDGGSWQPVGIKEKFPWPHVRDVVFDPLDPCSAWAAIGDFTPGTDGALPRTHDTGKTWQPVAMPVKPNSSMWVVRTQADNPQLVLAASRNGYLYRSDDAGHSWRKWGREFSEISSIVWIPD